MNDIATTLKECHKIVWDARGILSPYWPTPTTEDALLFTFTELGEAVDAHLRLKPQYARNNAKDLSVLDELADCALMLITALEGDCPPPNVNPCVLVEDKKTFQEINWNLSMAMIKQAEGSSWQSYAFFALCLLSEYPDMDLPARLTERLERIKWKRLPESWYIDNGKMLEWYYKHYKYDQGGEKSFEEWKANIPPEVMANIARQWGEPDAHGVVEHVGAK